MTVTVMLLQIIDVLMHFQIPKENIVMKRNQNIFNSDFKKVEGLWPRVKTILTTQSKLKLFLLLFTIRYLIGIGFTRKTQIISIQCFHIHLIF